ncbi:MAG: flippase-like domain-containing protein [Clostridiales bacterium]|nr:flippase-like domain-containing protein [Clostridiales bacterium]
MNEETNKTESSEITEATTPSENTKEGVIESVIERPDAPQTDASDLTNDSVPLTDPTAVKPSGKKRIAKIVFTVLFIAAMVAIIAYTAVHDFTGESVSNDRVLELIGSNWYYLLVLLGLFALTILIEAIKIFLMIRKTTRTYQFGTALTCAIQGKFYDYVTPLGSGGQPFQMYYLAKHGVPTGPAGAIPIGTLFLTQFSFFICAIVSFIVGVPAEIVPVTIRIVAYFGAVFYIIVPLFLVVFSFLPNAGHKIIGWGVKVCTKLRICKKPEEWLAKGNRAIDNNRKNMAILVKSKRVLIAGTLLSFLLVIAQCSMPFFSLLLVSDISQLLDSGVFMSSTPVELWFEVTRITFFIYCAITFIPTPGNSGAADGTFYGLFRTVLATVAGASFTGMMIWRVYSFYLYLLLGVIVLISVKVRDRINKKKNPLGNLG